MPPKMTRTVVAPINARTQVRAEISTNPDPRIRGRYKVDLSLKQCHPWVPKGEERWAIWQVWYTDAPPQTPKELQVAAKTYFRAAHAR